MKRVAIAVVAVLAAYAVWTFGNPMELRTEIEIAAPPERVWSILTAFPGHADWNPFIRSLEGEVREGATLTVSIEPPGGDAMTFRPTVLEVSPNERLRWLGRLGLPGVFDGEHVFELEPGPAGGTRFLHRERFRGVLVPWFAESLEAQTRRGFEEMNAALKEEAER
jgi:hypothetical protein